MDVPIEQPADEIRRLKTCISDLVGVFGLRAIWSGGDPSRIVSMLLDVLVATLRLDFAYARFQDPIGGAPVESVRLDHERNPEVRAPEFGRLLDVWLQDPQHAAVLRIPHPIGNGEVSIVVVRLGLQDAMGMLVAGSSRADFPLQTERVLLNVAANQAAIGLHEGRYLSQRAMELVAANEELNREIAERRRAEEALRLSEMYLAEAQRLSHTGSFGWDVESGNINWSDETYVLMGLDRTTRPTLDHVLQRVHPQDLAFFQDTLERVTRARAPIDFEHRLLRDDGSVKHVHVRAGPVYRAQGALEYVGAVTDVTLSKQAEAERLKLEERLRQAEKMEAIGTLAGGIAHDFNNILGVILGHGELAQARAGEAGPLRDHLHKLMQAGNRGKRLVEQILAFSHGGCGERVPVHVQSVIEETLHLLAASLPRTIVMEKMLSAADAAVVGDATHLHQVTMNLCTNAVQAMPHGGVLSVALERMDVLAARELSHGTLAPGPCIRLQVSDTGSGIPSAILERMFDPFFTTKRIGEGTGLGLSLVYGIVTDFGGAIGVETREGAGTAFTIWLPVSGETSACVADAAVLLPHGSGETVMIVDDECPMVNIAEEILAGLGYEPVGYSSSVEALNAFHDEPERYDIILTDETMPDMTGTDLAREIRGLRADLPVILMSGFSGPQLTERARSAGVSEILRKPLVSRDIAEPIARLLARRRRTAEL